MDLLDGKSEVAGQTVLPGMGKDMGYEAITLTPAVEKFCWEYVLNGGNGTQAYAKASPKVSLDSARKRASRLLKTEAVQTRLEQIREELRRKYNISAADIIDYHARVMKIDRRDFLNPHTGQVKEVHDIDSEAASILEVVFEKSPRKGGGIVVLLKVPTRHQSAVELARILGMHKETLQLNTCLENRPDADLQDEAERLAALITTLRGRKEQWEKEKGDATGAEPQLSRDEWLEKIALK